MNNTKKICFIIIFAVIVYAVFQNFAEVLEVFSKIISIVSPFILGACMAFVLNVPMKCIEKLLDSHLKGKIRKIIRPLSIIITLILVSGAIFTVFFMIVPELISTISVVGSKIGPFIEQVSAFLITQINSEYFTNFMNELSIDWLSIINKTLDFAKSNLTSFFGQTILAAGTIANVLINFFLGLVFSIYVLSQKEVLSRQSKLVISAYIPKKAAKFILDTAKLSNDVFSKFISGQCLEAVILGSLFFIAMTIFRFPYAVLISVLIGFLSLVPIFGAFVGCGIGVFLILINSPSQALFFLIMFIIIQQIEGNLIYPYVVGGSVGLPSIWVLVAVTIGGSSFGVLGMLLFIPLTAVIYITFRKITYDRIRRK